MRIVPLFAALSFAALATGMAGPASAQSLRIGPGGVEVNPGQAPERREYAPPRREAPRDELRERMFELRTACQDGDRRACVRLGIIIGENRERRAGWRRDHPDLFFWDR